MMDIPRYHINLFWSDEDNCWVADVPDLQYCSAFGHTPEQALQEIQIASRLWLESWLDDHDSPPPARYTPTYLTAKAG